MTLRSDDKQPWYKERWPWLLMAGPAIVVVAGITTLWLAVVSNDGLVTDDYYKQGMAVNQSLKRDHMAGDMGLNADLMRAGLNIRLLLGADKSVGLPQELVIKLAHPTRAGQDELIKMKQESQGFYTGRLADNVSGRWLLSIEDPVAGWRIQGEWMADSVEPLRLVAKAR